MNGQWMALTGAGSSVDAGLKCAADLTGLMDDLIVREEELTRFRYVCSVLAMSKAMQGQSPFNTLDIEEVFSAVDLLAQRQSLEIAPFVGAWLSGVESLDVSVSQRQQVDDVLNRTLRAVRARKGDGTWPSVAWEFREDFESAVRAVTSGDGSGYRELRYTMTKVLTQALAIDAIETVGYLTPLIRRAAEDSACRCLATLNYDLALEMAAEGASVPLVTDMPLPDEAHDDAISLLKLHGSISWSYPMRLGEKLTFANEPPSWIEIPWNGDMTHHSPLLVFGQRSKLRHDGPFLDLLAEFRRALSACDRVLVVGYSFRDAHVNYCLSKWLDSSQDHAIILLSPDSFTSDSQYYSIPDRMRRERRERFRHIEDTAEAGLADALELLDAL